MGVGGGGVVRGGGGGVVGGDGAGRRRRRRRGCRGRGAHDARSRGGEGRGRHGLGLGLLVQEHPDRVGEAGPRVNFTSVVDEERLRGGREQVDELRPLLGDAILGELHLRPGVHLVVRAVEHEHANLVLRLAHDGDLLEGPLLRAELDVLHALGALVGEHRVLAANLEQLLVEREALLAHHRPRGRPRSVEHRAAHRVVAARVLVRAVGGGALHAKLVAVVEARDALHQAQHHHGVHVVPGVVQVGRDARHIVVTQKVDELQPLEQVVLASQGVVEVLVIVLVEGVPGGVRHLVVGARVQAIVTHPVVVVAVDHLAHQQAVLAHRIRHPAELAPEVRLDLVRHVEAPPVDANLLQPKLGHVEDVVSNRGLRQVQPRKHGVPLPAVVREARPGLGVAPPLVIPSSHAHVVPVGELRVGRAVLHQILKRKVSFPRVVEDAVQHNLDVDVVQLLHDLLEQLDVAETPVDLEVIERVVAVRARLEERREVHRVDAQLLEVLVVVADVRQSGHNLRLAVVHRGRAEIPQREDLVEDRVVRPLGEVRDVLLVGVLPLLGGLDLAVRRHRGGDGGDVRVIVGPAVVDPHVANLLRRVRPAGGDEAVRAALPLRGAVVGPAGSDDVFVLDEGVRWERDGHLPLGALDPIHLDALGGRPVAEEVVSADEAQVVAEVGVAIDVEGDGDGGSRRGGGDLLPVRELGLGLLLLLLLLRLGELLRLSLRLGVLRQRLEHRGGLGEGLALGGGLRGGGDRGGIRGVVRAGVARGDGSEGRHRATRPARGRGERPAPGGDGRAGAARRGGAFGVRLREMRSRIEGRAGVSRGTRETRGERARRDRPVER